jgi:Lar family restriction alleviation protein
MKIALKPCPLCGGEAQRWVNDPWNDTFWVSCTVCGASDNSKGKSSSAATQAWNKGDVDELD